jgi:hypothetical protein
MFAYVARERGYNPKFANAKHMEKFGVWPPYGATPTPIPPTPECLTWIRSRAIAYAKRRSAAA